MILADDPQGLRKLVRRDLTVTVGGAVVAIWVYGLVAASRLGFVSRLSAGRAEVAVSALVGVSCLWWWAAGPRGLLRDRSLVLTPLFLVAGPGLYGVYELGGGVVVTMLSSALGFFAAIALGLAWSSRRSR